MKGNILHVCADFQQGGVTTFLREVVATNSDSDAESWHDIFFIFPYSVRKTRECDYYRQIYFPRLGANMISRWIRARRIFNNYKAVFVHKLHPAIFFPLLFSRTPVFVFQHGLTVGSGGRLKRILKKCWYSSAIPVIGSRVIGSTEYAFRKSRKAGIRIPRKRRIIIPFGIRLGEVKRKTEPFDPKSERIVVGSAGRLAKIKRFDRLIRSFQGYARELFLDVRIAGEGPERTLLSKLAEDVNRSHSNVHVHLMNHVEDMGAFYRSLDLFVFPSHDESFGLVVLEALAHGIPVAVFEDLGGSLQLVKSGGNGLLIKPGEEGLRTLWDRLNQERSLPGDLRANVNREDLSAYDIKQMRSTFDSLAGS